MDDDLGVDGGSQRSTMVGINASDNVGDDDVDKDNGQVDGGRRWGLLGTMEKGVLLVQSQEISVTRIVGKEVMSLLDSFHHIHHGVDCTAGSNC